MGTNLVNFLQDIFQLLLGRSEAHCAKNIVLENFLAEMYSSFLDILGAFEVVTFQK